MRLIDALIDELRHHEGFVSYLYDDATSMPEPIRSGYTVIGTPTIGYGTNVMHISRAEADFLLRFRAYEAIDTARTIFSRVWERLDATRQLALANLAYNLGPARLRGFARMRRAIEDGDFELAANEALDSRWARQVGRRARHVAEQIRRGSGWTTIA